MCVRRLHTLAERAEARRRIVAVDSIVAAVAAMCDVEESILVGVQERVEKPSFVLCIPQ